MEGFAAVLMDGWPLPASSERLNQRGAVITGLPTLLLELRGGRGSRGGAKRAGVRWRAGEGRCAEAGDEI